MARVTLDDVKAILPTGTTLTDPQITAAITAATLVVDQIAAGCGEFLTAETLKQVEVYLSAHFAAATEFTLSKSSETIPGCNARVTYGWQLKEGVMGSPFGQMANTLSGGCLAEQDKRPVGFFSIGSHGGSA